MPFPTQSYDRPAALAWLSARFVGPFDGDTSPATRAELIDWLSDRCRTMRAQGLAAAWHYSLPDHTELCRILAAERAALAAIESTPAYPDRLRLRAA